MKVGGDGNLHPEEKRTQAARSWRGARNCRPTKGGFQVEAPSTCPGENVAGIV